MIYTLGHIASIQTGIFAKTVFSGDVVYLQAKHFNGNGQLISQVYPNLQKESIAENHLLHFGDIIFAAKGTKNFAACYQSKNVPAVASTSFFVIRINESFKNKILPEFLTWTLNNPKSQKILKGKAIGTSMVSISKYVLEGLEISIPEINIQKFICEITNLRNKEKILMQKIEDFRDVQIQNHILKALK